MIAKMLLSNQEETAIGNYFVKVRRSEEHAPCLGTPCVTY